MNDPLEKLMFEELRNACRGGGASGVGSGARPSGPGTCFARSAASKLALGAGVRSAVSVRSGGAGMWQGQWIRPSVCPAGEAADRNQCCFASHHGLVSSTGCHLQL